MKTHLFFLAILFSFAFSRMNAQCPSGDIQIYSQEHLNEFLEVYPDCTHVTGNLILGEFNGFFNNISDLSGLINFTKIDGYLGIFSTTKLFSLTGLNNIENLGGLNMVSNSNLESVSELINVTALGNNQLQIAHNPNLKSLHGLNNIQTISGRLYLGYENNSLTSLEGLKSLISVGGIVYINGTNFITLEGLNNLTTVGEWVAIGYNEQLTSIEALENLIYAGGGISIEGNPQLTSLNGIQNINPSSFGGEENGLDIKNNQNLTTCNLPNICEYLSFDPTENPREIIGNTGNCTDEQSVLAACGLGVNDVENEMANWQVHYKKENNKFLVQSKGFEIADIQVYSLNGQLIKEFNGLNSNQEEISVFSPDNILIIKVISSDGKSFAKKVMVK